MLRIEWDKEFLENQMKLFGNSYSILDYWTPLFVYINDIEVSGLKDIPAGGISHIIEFFPELMSIFKIIDPERLGKKEFIVSRRSDENRVTSVVFEFTVELDKENDILTINYTNKGIKEWRTVNIPLKEFAEGALSATKEIISDVERIAPNESATDDWFIALKMEHNTIRSWYEERYGAPVEVKYVIPERFF